MRRWTATIARQRWHAFVAVLAATASMVGGVAAATASRAVEPQLTIAVSVDKTEVSYPGRNTVAFEVSLRTGPQAVDYALFIAPSRFTTRRAGLTTLEGSTMRQLRRPPQGLPFDLSGQATLLYLGSGRGQPACSPVQNRFHGIGEPYLMAALSMPANAEAQLTAHFETGVVPPWPGDEHSVTVTAQPLPTSASTLTRPTDPVRSPSVALRGTTGTRITLTSTPRGYPPGTKTRRSARLGRTIDVRGTTEPPLRARTITLRQVAPQSHALTQLARVRTTRDGRFTYRWKPNRPGFHELWAFSPSGPGRVADHTCPISIRVTRARSTA